MKKIWPFIIFFFFNHKLTLYPKKPLFLFMQIEVQAMNISWDHDSDDAHRVSFLFPLSPEAEGEAKEESDIKISIVFGDEVIALLRAKYMEWQTL